MAMASWYFVRIAVDRCRGVGADVAGNVGASPTADHRRHQQLDQDFSERDEVGQKQTRTCRDGKRREKFKISRSVT